MPAQTRVSMERKLAAILSADVAGYSRLMGEAEEATIRTLTAYREVTDSLIHQHRGRVVNTAGDSVLAEFASAVDALQCAVEIQQKLKVKNADLPSERKMEFRIGINVGDVVAEGEQLYGDGVNVAARVQALADAGGILISGTVYDQVKNKLVLSYEDLGERTVKNIADPVRVWRVRLEEKESSTFKVQSSKSKEERPKLRRAGIARRKELMVAVVSLLLIAGILIAIRYFPLSPLSTQDSALRTEAAPAALPLPDKPSIAVLPFTNMSGDPEQEYFSDGMTDDLITGLSNLSGLFVISRHSVFTYKGKAVKVQEVSRDLGVRYVLEGSVRKSDGKVRITAQLIDATTGGHLWSGRYDRELKDIFALQEEIKRKIVVHLALKLTDVEGERLEHIYTTSPEAYDYRLRGMEYMWRFTKETHAQARQMCERAIELDPSYALAHSLLGWTYLQEWGFQWSQDPQNLERAFALVQKTLALDDSLPAAHELLGLVHLLKNKQPEQAVVEMERAVALSPNWYSAYAALGISLNFAGRPAEAIEAVEKAMRLNPRNPVYLASYLTVLGGAYRLTGRYKEAIAALKKALSFYPNYPGPHQTLAVIYSELGREKEAQAEAAEILRISPNYSLEGVRQRLPFKDPAESERVLAALRKAGLK